MSPVSNGSSPERNAWVYAVSAAAYNGGHETVRVLNEILNEAFKLADENKILKEINEQQLKRLDSIEASLSRATTHPFRFLLGRIRHWLVYRGVLWT